MEWNGNMGDPYGARGQTYPVPSEQRPIAAESVGEKTILDSSS